MIFLFHDDAKKELIELRGEEFKYLIKVRRHTLGDMIALRNRDDSRVLYSYLLQAIDAKSATLKLLKSELKESLHPRNLHLGWCLVDEKSIEKSLPGLSEIGVAKITFITCQRSQKNFRPDFARLDRILYASMQQSGRSHKMELDSISSLELFLSNNPHAKIFDFSSNVLDPSQRVSCAVIGCEGGFTAAERELFRDEDTFGLQTPMVLRSESAAIAVASKILL